MLECNDRTRESVFLLEIARSSPERIAELDAALAKMKVLEENARVHLVDVSAKLIKMEATLARAYRYKNDVDVDLIPLHVPRWGTKVARISRNVEGDTLALMGAQVWHLRNAREMVDDIESSGSVAMPPRETATALRSALEHEDRCRVQCYDAVAKANATDKLENERWAAMVTVVEKQEQLAQLKEHTIAVQEASAAAKASRR